MTGKSMMAEIRIELMFILREKAEEYKRNMLKIYLDIFWSPLIQG